MKFVQYTYIYLNNLLCIVEQADIMLNNMILQGR